MFIILPCSQRALILVLEHVSNFGVRFSPGCSRHGISGHCLCVRMLSLYATGWPVCYAAIVGMFSLSDALPMPSYPSKVWVLCQCGRAELCAAQLICFYRSNFLHEIGGISWLTLWRCWLHSCGMFILLVEYGLVHRWLYKLWDMLFLLDPAFVWPSLGRADFHST